jgi:16S rRNA (adenine1518-N6/adenine1519-N6)-dimethyltransferase
VALDRADRDERPSLGFHPAAPAGVKVEVLERVTGAAFGQRRKMLRQSLKGVPGALDALASLGIDAARRAETVSVAEFVAIARALT